MNRIADIIQKIQDSQSMLEALKKDYQDKKKGEIYFNTKGHHERKIKALEKGLHDSYCEVPYNQWTLLVGKRLRPHTRVVLILDTKTTEEEIRTYFEQVLMLSVENLINEGPRHKIGFPSFHQNEGD